ncbi:MAG: type IV secretory system conjugative DNA transfer family protein [Clostridia bacterium]
MSLNIGLDTHHQMITLPEKSLYQNILITGTIGSGKTSSAMYPFTRQLISHQSDKMVSKIGMLILDVKGNYYKQVLDYASIFHRTDDIILLDLSGKFRYNPLHKPHLKASVLANRLKSILLLFSPNQTESFWLDKAEEVLRESIKLCRFYNHGYVTFEELHQLITFPLYYKSKLEILRSLFLKNVFSKEEIYELLSALTFFEKEYYQLDARTLSLLKSEITRITNLFISDYQVKHVFCSPLRDLNFLGFSEVIQSGKIVVLNMNIAHYKNLAKVIAAYLKLDFQTEVLERLTNIHSSDRPVCFISDEYHEYVTANDADFFAQSREAKCINIVATQSYTSLLNALPKDSNVKVIIQNLVNKLWFRTDDLYTIESAQKQIGKEEKQKVSNVISENAKETNFNYLLQSFCSTGSNVSESYNTYFQSDFIFDTNFFTQELETFSCLCFLSDGNKILKPQKLNLIPYFK